MTRLVQGFQDTFAQRVRVKEWEIFADRLSKAGWSLGWVSAIHSEGRTIWIADARGDDGIRFIVHPDEKLTACNGIGRISDRTN